MGVNAEHGGQDWEIDVNDCVFDVKDPKGSVIKTVRDVYEAFELKKMFEGSTVHVRATVDVTLEELAKIQLAQQDEGLGL